MAQSGANGGRHGRTEWDVVVVGAGLAGLACAHDLIASGEGVRTLVGFLSQGPAGRRNPIGRPGRARGSVPSPASTRES